VLLFSAALVAGWIVGYGLGLGSGRALSAQLALALLVSLVVLIILDPARPRRGLIRIAQQSLIDLKASPGRAR